MANRFRPWADLEKIAAQEVASVQASLPQALHAAAKVAVVLEKRPSRAMVRSGLDPDLLGLFVGGAIDAEPGASTLLPPQVVLFVLNLWGVVGGSEPEFREQVRITYLHELGHYLGLDEAELDDRGLA